MVQLLWPSTLFFLLAHSFFSVLRPRIFGERMWLKSDIFSNSCYLLKNRVRAKRKGFVLLKYLREIISGVGGVSADENGNRSPEEVQLIQLVINFSHKGGSALAVTFSHITVTACFCCAASLPSHCVNHSHTQEQQFPPLMLPPWAEMRRKGCEAPRDALHEQS